MTSPQPSKAKDDRRWELRAAAARVHRTWSRQFKRLGADEVMLLLRGDGAAGTRK